MKHLIYLTFAAYVMLSCSNATDETTDHSEDILETEQQDSLINTEAESPTELLQITALLEDNPTRIQYESLLNSFYEPFEELPYEEIEIKSSELVYGFSQFRTTESRTTVKFYFADFQDDLIEFGQLNFVEGLYGVNGGGLFYVTGEDDQAVNDVLSWFSGAE